MTAPSTDTAPRRRGRLQNLREFSVRIFQDDPDLPVGTGIAVRDKHGAVVIVTCAHVVRDALPQDAPPDADVGVYFPQARVLKDEEKVRRARVAGRRPEPYQDDVLLLHLTGDTLAPLAPEQVAILGRAETSEGHPFRSYGYPGLGEVLSSWVDGVVFGPIEIKDVKLTRPLVELRTESSEGFLPGLSGSAVLDTERNLVVGLISERFRPQTGYSNRGWSLDAQVLTFESLDLPVQEDDLPLRPPKEPQVENLDRARAATTPTPGRRLEGAPAPLPEWVGRVGFLQAINRDWANERKRVTGLIGFGGEGKSSLARQWLENLLNDPAQPQPEGVFWWPFYDRRSVDEFFEASINFLVGGVVDPRAIPSSSAKVQMIGAMLTARRYLFVLDGLEVMQHNDGDRYGMVDSNDLRDLLAFFASGEHNSFCLITSRAPVTDLIEYDSYTHRDVERLDEPDGRDLLRKIGVSGADAALDVAVNAWDGHALTLGLIGSLLAKEHDGDIAHLADLPQPTDDDSRYARVHHVLEQYDRNLTDTERAFLKLFSAFRTPVKPDSFERVFRTSTDQTSVNAPLAALDDATFNALVERLGNYRLLRFNLAEGEYTTHPLIRNHYFALLSQGAGAAETHANIKEYYLGVAGDVPYFPTMDDLQPLIEVVYHACRAGAYDEAHEIRRDRIDQDTRFVLAHQLGAYETELAIMLEFFPGGDTTQNPAVSEAGYQSWILNTTGFCLMSLGRLTEAAPFLERAAQKYMELENWAFASMPFQNLCNLNHTIGDLSAAATAADEALALARRADDKEYECNSLVYQAWNAHLQGDMANAGTAFQQAEALERVITDMQYLYSDLGIDHAGHLRRAGEADYARHGTEANLTICESNRWIDKISQCHRVLGDLDADAGQHDSAGEHYAAALKIARGISYLSVLIEALIAQGHWLARHMYDTLGAFSLLNEALGYCVESGYCLYEADCRVALAWAYLRDGKPDQARAEALNAKNSSASMGYHWGQVDADEVLAEIGE